MSLRKLPRIEALSLPESLRWDVPASALAKYNPALAAKEDETSISIYGAIGEFDGEVSSRRIAAALRAIGNRDVTVNINSPGGDFFEGVAIYNLLREHKAKVKINVVGLAASAASIVAMAGDEIRIGKAAFLMIHNSWSLVIGNRHDLAEAMAALESFDNAMAGIYVDRTGLPKAEIAKMMDAETWLNGEQAIESGFADAFLPADEIDEVEEAKAGKAKALHTIDNLLAKAGVSRSQRRQLFKELQDTPSAVQGSTPSAAATVTPSADDTWAKALQDLHASLVQ